MADRANTSVRLDRDLLDRVEVQCRERMIGRNLFITRAVENQLMRMEQPEVSICHICDGAIGSDCTCRVESNDISGISDSTSGCVCGHEALAHRYDEQGRCLQCPCEQFTVYPLNDCDRCNGVCLIPGERSTDPPLPCPKCGPS